MTLLASLMPLMPSWMAEGHLRSVRLTPCFSSFWIASAGSKWKVELLLEQLVRFLEGCSVRFATGLGVKKPCNGQGG